VMPSQALAMVAPELFASAAIADEDLLNDRSGAARAKIVSYVFTEAASHPQVASGSLAWQPI